MKHHGHAREHHWTRFDRDHWHDDASHHDSLHDAGWHGHRMEEDRVGRMEELQRDLEEMTADVATQLANLRRRESR